MSYVDVGRAILIVIVVYSAAFFWSPSTTASYMPDTGPVNEIMRRFRYWERRRVWVAGISIGGSLLLALLSKPPVAFIVAFTLGLMALLVADMLQIRGLARDRHGISSGPRAGDL